MWKTFKEKNHFQKSFDFFCNFIEISVFDDRTDGLEFKTQN